jgi:serine/threonine-protein kinase
MEPALSEVDLRIEPKNETAKTPSFTQIWENDMGSRFGATVFVPLEPGEKIKGDKLEIVGQVAFGGLSAIYPAKSNQDQLRIVKEAVLPSSADKESKDKAIQLFEREAQLLMKLRHSRIAVVEDYFTENGRHYLLLEHIDGKDLRRFVKEKGLPSEAMVIRWLKEISEILQYLHEQNPPIIHRDLTPDNLILTRDGNINLIDFGAANTFLGTAAGTIVGKQSYISPEQFRGKATPASDLYSLGATAFFLLSGADPEALSQSDLGLVNPEISLELRALVSKLTSLDANERPASAKELLKQLENLVSQNSIQLKLVEEKMLP